MPVGSPSAVLDCPSVRLNLAEPLSNVISPYVPEIVLSLSLTSNENDFVLSLSVRLTTVLETVRPPFSRALANDAEDFSSEIVPVSPLLVVVKPAAFSSSTVYSAPTGRPVAVFVSPCFSFTVAAPSLNVMSPYVPVIGAPVSVTVNVNVCDLSAAASDVTVLVISRSPVLRVLVNAASAGSSEILPVSPVLFVVNPSAVSSSTSYVIPVGSPSAFSDLPSVRLNCAFPSWKFISP